MIFQVCALVRNHNPSLCQQNNAEWCAKYQAQIKADPVTLAAWKEKKTAGNKLRWASRSEEKRENMKERARLSGRLQRKLQALGF
ncbi:hypothetical protein PoB_006294000 [Plakobranchus ocellatus]|uniref:Uncharacterized protein n=1 Tax=Plakobranchus ocellatus TaxID=259542 RepID=A0AAV4CX61_9GAST|nr:hypothetical protein PoB_006294000 [Plakobranchus ocellatus]